MTKLSMSEEEMLMRKYTRPYEKRITELEKENAELKESYCLRRCKHCEFLHENGNCLKVGGYFTAVDNKDCPILKDKVELIKENAELKELLKDKSCLDCKHLHTDLQLTKAKELFKRFMKFYERTARECYSKDFQKTLAEAEQFLNEVEKWK